MDTMAYRSAVMAAQGIISAYQPSLVVDGKWGDFTQKAFSDAAPNIRARVDAVLGALGTSVGALSAARAVQKTVESSVSGTSGGDEWIAETQAKAMVRREAARLGVGVHAVALERFLDLEAVARSVQGLKFYKLTSKNGSSTGLMQMQPAAWIDSRKIDPTLPSFADGVFKAESNIAAGIAYAKSNIRAMEQSGVPITGNNLYLAHNQGAGHFQGIVTGFDCQSSAVRAMIKQSILSMGKTPTFRDSPKCGHSKW